MHQVNVTIAGRTYRMVCGEGEEAHLEKLANLLDTKIEELRASFGEIGDMRLHVMAALTIADDLSETTRLNNELKEQVMVLQGHSSQQAAQYSRLEEKTTQAVLKTTERLEKLVKVL